ncbi:MAG: prepilin-type N-terminal cleavage/methylation domain-containing protein, partial [Ghiorsea sp.]|nr:prepilin-type N-terminal cleavage/methylation domain-containing protein [Ghiorsea sp.]
AKGFTLIETLVALGIAAVALTALAGRLGLSADTQRSLLAHATMLEVATNVLEQQRVGATTNLAEREGEVEARGMAMKWKLSLEKTDLDLFVRQNVVVTYVGEPDVALFLYHVKPR